MKGEPKARAQKAVLQSVLSIDTPDHCGRDLVGTTIHPDRDCILLWGRVQVDCGSPRWHSQGGAGWCLEGCTNRRNICRRRGEREPLRSRRGVGGCCAGVCDEVCQLPGGWWGGGPAASAAGRSGAGKEGGGALGRAAAILSRSVCMP